MTEVTISRARQLDRAMTAMHRDNITYGRWVEVLRAWCDGEDVSGWELGHETVPERIMLRFHGRIVSAEEVATTLELRSIDTAAVSLNRMAQTNNKRAKLMARGRFKITGRIA